MSAEPAAGDRATGRIRTVLGDVDPASVADGVVYCHEHLIIDSPLIAAAFEHIHLHDVEAAIAEVGACAAAGASLMVDTMPASAGRDAVRLARISRATGVPVVAATGLHHDRYYGPTHWTNRVPEDALVRLFLADLLEGVDEHDYTGPVVVRTPHRAGIVKVATSGAEPDERDRRNLRIAAAVHVASGAPVLTHCEGGVGGMAQVEALVAGGVAPDAIILSHVDKAGDLGALIALAETGAVLELDQTLRQADAGAGSISVRAVLALAEAGHADRVVLGTDGARRSLWTSLGGAPGLAWLAASFPRELLAAGLDPALLPGILGGNAARALAWR